MKEITGDIFDVEADAICVPTNGIVKSNGELVMGAGLARQFASQYPALPRTLGRAINLQGNQAVWFSVSGSGADVISFPTKEHWQNPSTEERVRTSARQLTELARLYYPEDCTIVLPRVGCGLGGLDWETQVKPILEPILDDRFHIITPR